MAVRTQISQKVAILRALFLSAAMGLTLVACSGGTDHTTTIQPPPPPPPPSRDAETIIFSGKESDAAISPESIFIAQDDQQGQEKIAGGFAPGNEISKFQPSPDGQWIAYIIKTPTSGTDLVVMPVNGGPRTILNAGLKSPVDLFSTDIGDFSWSPDSQQVAFTAVLTGSRDRERLYLINRDGSDLRNLNEGQTDTQSYGNPQFSPDGRYIIQEVSRIINRNVAPLPFALQFTDLTLPIPNNTELTAANGAVTNVRWSPNSTSLCFALNNSITDPDAYNIRVSDVSITAPNTFIASEGGNAESECRWTPNGTQLTFIDIVDQPSPGQRPFKISTFDPTGSGSIENRGGPVRFFNNGGGENGIRKFEISPDDGRSIVILFQNDDGAFELANTTFNGGFTILNGPLVSGGNVIDFKWSPDASRVAFIADAQTPGRRQLFVRRANDFTNEFAPVEISDFLGAEEVVEFDWSSDSSCLVFSVAPDAPTPVPDRLYVGTVDGADLQLISTTIVAQIDDIAYAN